MNKMILSGAALAAATFAAMPATAATIIDFNNFGSTYVQGPDYFEDGYKLSVAICGATSNCFRAVDPALSIDSTGTSVLRGGGATTITVQREDGGAFEFASMDFGKLKVETSQPWTHSSTYEFKFTLADAAATVVTEYFTFLHDNPNPIVARTATFDGLGAITQFTFRNQSTAGQFDNIVLNGIAAVPEPASWAMMIGGFALAGASMRRRRIALRLA